tara:strand:+ start:1360 stop:2364 length:1005 start_codon:yes stop_codon:yes gene_type:complete
LISIDQKIGFFRNFGFLRFIILFVAFNYFFKEKFFLKNVLKSWTLILSFILIDIFIENFTGRNLVGFGEIYNERIVSFFKDEPIVGGFINSFYLIIIGFLFTYFKNKNLILIFSIIFLIAILATGERSNGIKAILGLLIFYVLLKEYDLKKKITLLISVITLITVIIFSSDFLKSRYIGQIKSHIYSDQIYFKLYKSGFLVFKNHQFFGVGNKNYRIEACGNKHFNTEKKNEYFCNTHPHQIYIELLSEHGIVGSIIILFLLYKIIFSKISLVFKEQNYMQIGSFIYLTTIFTPLIPSGAFFGDYMLTLYMINMSIFYCSNKKLNIFNSVNNKI